MHDITQHLIYFAVFSIDNTSILCCGVFEGQTESDSQLQFGDSFQKAPLGLQDMQS